MIPIQRVLKLIPPSYLEKLGMDMGVNACNQVRLPGHVVFVCLLNTIVNNPVVTQRLLEETYTLIYGGCADHSSFGKRLNTLDPAYFQAIHTHLYRELSRRGSGKKLPARGFPEEPPALRVRWVDATTVTLSAKLLQFGLLQDPGGRADPDGISKW